VSEDGDAVPPRPGCTFDAAWFEPISLM